MGQFYSTFSRAIVGAGLTCALWAAPGFTQEQKEAVFDHKIIVLGQDISSAGFIEARDDFNKNLQIAGTRAIGGQRTFEGFQNGIAGKIFDSVRRGEFRAPESIALFANDATGLEQCKEAKEAKIAYHDQTDAGLPPAFGKIVDFNMVESHQFWTGSVDLCTWVSNGLSYDEYFFHIDFEGHDEGTVFTHVNSGDPDDPFPGTLIDPPADIQAMMNEWLYKLHGSGSAIRVTSAFKNGEYLPPSDPVYINDQDCFDFFLNSSDDLKTMINGELPDQAGYCMGRCDGLIMNTK